MIRSAGTSQVDDMMRDRKKVLTFPAVAQPSIDEVLSLFLREQQRRLKTRTFHRYEEVVDLLRRMR